MRKKTKKFNSLNMIRYLVFDEFKIFVYEKVGKYLEIHHEIKFLYKFQKFLYIHVVYFKNFINFKFLIYFKLNLFIF